MQALFGAAFGPPPTVDVVLTNTAGRASRTVELEGGKREQLYLYTSGDDVAGEVRISVPAGKKVEHLGVKIELQGIVELFGDRSQSHVFASLVRELAPAGSLSTGTQLYRFSFPKVDMPYESYEGINARCRYVLRAVVARTGYSGHLVREADFLVQIAEPPPVADSSVKLEVGIEDCLHIEFEYDRSRYHLGDVVTGRVNFLLVRIKIKYMEVAVIRREAAGLSGGVVNESETLTRFEVMDGIPVKGEVVPIRLYLSGLDLTPSYANVAHAFTVRYFLNLVLVDDEERRYFKQQEITLWRKGLGLK